ncbi:MAG: DNA polymerase I [Aeromonadales bacterium]|nr:DNA polymerase I [Aeromonadales bacterium]MDY2890056.1 DNA polymerase I [Succinivibrio sp.]
MADKQPLILIDGSSFLYRAFYVSRDRFTSSSGIPTGVSMVMARMFSGIVKRFPHSPIIAVFDAHGKSFRAKMYPEYKANRPPMPDELRIQLDYVKRLVQGMGMPLVQVPGVEADDVLGTYAKRAESKGMQVVICTGDKDLAQLVDDQVTLLDTMSGKAYDAEAVKEKFGVGPSRIIDLLALKGDASDNIPGMSGCGDKTAVALISALGGVEDIYARRGEIATLSFRGAKAFAPKYEAQIENIRLSRDLATIRTDVDLPVDESEVKPPVKDTDALIKLYDELEFHKLKDELMQEVLSKDISGAKVQAEAPDAAKAAPAPSAPKAPETTDAEFEPFSGEHEDHASRGTVFTLVNDEAALDALCKRITEAGLAAVDTETTSLRPEEASLVGISVSVKEGEGFYIPVGHAYLGAPAQMEAKKVLSVLGKALAGVKIIGHNIKYDMLVLSHAGYDMPQPYADTMLMAHLLDSAQSVAMDELALRYLNYKDISYDEVTGTGRARVSFSQVEVSRACEYSGEDAEVTLRLYNRMLPLLEARPALMKSFRDIEMPLLHVLYKMELNGVLVDRSVLAAQNRTLSAEMVQMQKDVYTCAGEEFNISSPKQLGHILFEKLAIPYPKKRKAGASYSTAEDILEAIAPDYDIASLVLRYRELSKLVSTYTEKLQTLIDPKTHRIYTSFNQAGTVTGRLSSSDPNLQNIPARTHEGKLIRKAFIAPEGCTLISADYSQIELRLIAHIAQDEGLIRAFRAGYDIHRATAAEVLGKRIEDVTPEERSRAKATNFGLMYGMGAFGLRRQTRMGMQEAREYIDRYFSRYPRVRDYMEQTKKFAHEHGYVTTITGREIVIKNINSQSQMLMKGGERAAINAPMQGSAADIIKLAMIAVQKWIETLPEGAVRMTVQVHDELLFEVQDALLEEAKARIKELMEGVVQLRVPLLVGIGAASNWDDAH